MKVKSAAMSTTAREVPVPPLDPLTLTPLPEDPAALFSFKGHTFCAEDYFDFLAAQVAEEDGQILCPLTRAPLGKAEVTDLEQRLGKAPGSLAAARAAAAEKKALAESGDVFYNQVLLLGATETLHCLDGILCKRGPFHPPRQTFIRPSPEVLLRQARVAHHKAAIHAVSLYLPQFSSACLAIARFARDRYPDFLGAATGVLQRGTASAADFASLSERVQAILDEAPVLAAAGRTYTLRESMAMASGDATWEVDARDKEALLRLISPPETPPPAPRRAPLRRPMPPASALIVSVAPAAPSARAVFDAPVPNPFSRQATTTSRLQPLTTRLVRRRLHISRSRADDSERKTAGDGAEQEEKED